MRGVICRDDWRREEKCLRCKKKQQVYYNILKETTCAIYPDGKILCRDCAGTIARKALARWRLASEKRRTARKKSDWSKAREDRFTLDLKKAESMKKPRWWPF